jgi:hypothetical protein
MYEKGYDPNPGKKLAYAKDKRVANYTHVDDEGNVTIELDESRGHLDRLENIEQVLQKIKHRNEKPQESGKRIQFGSQYT